MSDYINNIALLFVIAVLHNATTPCPFLLHSMYRNRIDRCIFYQANIHIHQSLSFRVIDDGFLLYDVMLFIEYSAREY